MRHAPRNYYEVLDVPRDASKGIIEERCVRLGEQYHPDKNIGDISAAILFAQIEEAFETLTDPAKRAAYDAVLAQPVKKSIESLKGNGNIYPEEVLQRIAHDLAATHTFCAPGISNEIDPNVSFESWSQVEHFVLYAIESAIRLNEQLHPQSKSRLIHLLVEAWVVDPGRKPFAQPSSGIVPRMIVTLVVKTGLHSKLDRDGYVKFRTWCDKIFNSPYRKTTLKDYNDMQALTLVFLMRMKEGRTNEGQPIRYGGTGTQIEGLFVDCFASAVQRIQNGLYPIASH